MYFVKTKILKDSLPSLPHPYNFLFRHAQLNGNGHRFGGAAATLAIPPAATCDSL